ncbi:efflux RND transporter periplasmic adaptor subunit [Winogradskyella haliclonae]|uniref:Hemolysin secretion protein D n=1 Tax=Winogradskyella haliclonae TaxID=2048558 RepID=A0ABQ2BYZ3_9FLAO|nr:efflux RND transporter periplasmic adaptor subunit [Winogradskyella haliclonae]GGI56998.1 hemolysin secretion protein D [Winogradskyella haliclonae]
MKAHIHLFSALILFLSLNSCKEKTETKEEVLRPVKYEVVGTSNAQTIRTFSGSAKAMDAINLSFRSGGIITKVNHWKGASVKKGDVIAKLDNIEANLAYEQSVSSLNAARSAMNTAKSSLDRVKSLYEKGSNSLADYEQAKNSYQSALDQFESAKRNKSIQATQLSYGVIRAPKDGVIAWTDGAVNEQVSAGHTFAGMNAGEGLKVEIGLPEAIVNRVTVNMNTELKFTALEGKIFEGRVFEVSPSIDPSSSTYITAIEILNPIPEIKPGMATNVTFDFDNEEKQNDNTLVIPLKAVGEDGNGNFVFIINSEDGKTGTVKKQAIEVGELSGSGFEVKSGLNAGDKIATAGLQTLLDGQKVRLQ